MLASCIGVAFSAQAVKGENLCLLPYHDDAMRQSLITQFKKHRIDTFRKQNFASSRDWTVDKGNRDTSTFALEQDRRTFGLKQYTGDVQDATLASQRSAYGCAVTVFSDDREWEVRYGFNMVLEDSIPRLIVVNFVNLY
jgi:hypothetical protein